MPKNVALRVDIDPTVNVWADRTQTQQVLLNLLWNAVESIGDRTGEVCVETFRPSSEDLRFPDAVIVPEPVDSPLLAIRITDTGAGMDAQRALVR